MEEKRVRKRSADQIDLPILWVLIRAGEILYAVVFAKLVYLTKGTGEFVENAISSAGLMLIIFLFLHRVVTGRADSVGIHYRRYFRRKTLRWTDVQEIQWINWRLRVLIRGKKKPRAILEFLMNPLKWTGAYWAHRLGAEVAPPAILERIQALPADTPPMISAPPYARWVKRLFLGVWILFLLVLLIRLLLAFSAQQH